MRADGSPRGPVKQVRLLLPVWGEQFIVQFLRVSLPTLLAPGNLPAVAAAVPSTFVFLTDTAGAELLRGHPATAYMQTICKVEYAIIDDLITGDNYSTTLTLGYARSIRATGAEMRDTCFFFLISDYIMADGSLANVLARVQAGYSGVLAGNFQVVEEDAKEPLFEKFETGEPSVVIAARDLVSWALNYLHPMTLANTVNFPIFHNCYSNRLFWRVDENTLIGRFYLMHMIAIRPEVLEFEIGSSCDYSFVPELCPSGNVHVITESDEYLVVEMQRRAHEERFIDLGAFDRSALASSLAEWTTERHRMNAHFPVVYRASELVSGLPSVIEESQRFIESIESSLPAAQPYRDHPYWIGAIAAHRRALRKRMKEDSSTGAKKVVPPPNYHDYLFLARDFFLGRPTQVAPWHPRWPDYQTIQRMAGRYLRKDAPGRTLLLSGTPATFQDWLHDSRRSVDSVNISQLIEYDADQYQALVDKYDGCLLLLRETELNYLSELLARIKPLLSVGDCLQLCVLNGQGWSVESQFSQPILREANALFDRNMQIEEAEFVAAGWASWAALRGLRRLYTLAVHRPLFLLFTAVPVGFLLTFSLLGNLVGRRTKSRPVKNKLCSSMSVVLRVLVKSEGRPNTRDSSELKQSRRRFVRPLLPAPSEKMELVQGGGA